ncbi:MAG: alpha-L-fucosidase, partial [Bacteroidales bacterium]|nr:alpha-L-fucosidase [Bacteroidales bacterium]
MKKYVLLFVSIGLFLSCAKVKDTTYEKHLVFPSDASQEKKIEMISHLVPNKAQLEWQQMELTAFLHFGINTFTGNEWGDGKDDPKLFNPTQLNCDQWVKALKDADFKMAILTAKHHDGFCLWQTQSTEYSVKNSPWKNGKGDVVRELRDACEKYGIKFGIYL